MTRLLEGVRVIESAAVITGPFAGMMLADMGADVIKVEPPAGDQFRRWESDEVGVLPTFAAYNRGKRSIQVDLKSETGRELYERLVASADVVIENFRPGAMDKLGLGYEQLKERHPKLVYCHISGLGTTGPDRDKATFDAVAQAMSGLWSQLTDLSDPEPVGPPFADQLTATYAVMGVLAALQRRHVTGLGTKVETNMLASCLAFQAPSVASLTHDGDVATKTSRARQSQSYAFVAGDGLPFAVHLSTPKKFWAGLCQATGMPELVDDPRYDTKPKRMAAYDELHETFDKVVRGQPRQYWLDRLEAQDVPCAPILTVDETVNHPQVVSNGLVESMDAEQGLAGLVKSPLRVDGQHLAAARPAPRLGAGADSVLEEIGWDRGTA